MFRTYRSIKVVVLTVAGLLSVVATGQRVFGVDISCGDVNLDGDINLLDILESISFVYGDGMPSENPWAMDVNDCDGAVNLLDIMHLIDKIYSDGPPPVCCEQSGYFTMEAKYEYIVSCHNGGGIFPVMITVDPDFGGYVEIALDADPDLHAKAWPQTVTAFWPVTEITIRPDSPAVVRLDTIWVTATHLDSAITIPLEVDLNGFPGGDPEHTLEKKEQLVDWLETEHPEFGSFEGLPWYGYVTYPGILIVEHWTYIYDEWEMRICFHVMIPPYDWSMIWLRRRGELEPRIAAKREHNGITYEIHEIPIEEYPTFYGY